MPEQIFALCEGTLPDYETLQGYVQYTNPLLPTFPNGPAALYVEQDLPQHPPMPLHCQRVGTSGWQCRFG